MLSKQETENVKQLTFLGQKLHGKSIKLHVTGMVTKLPLQKKNIRVQLMLTQKSENIMERIIKRMLAVENNN